MSESPIPLFNELDIHIRLSPGFPEIHEAYRSFRDQKDMVCGPYVMTYLCRAFGIHEFEGKPLTVDTVAREAGTALEPHNVGRDNDVKEKIERGDLTPDQARARYMHDYFDVDLRQASEGGTSAEGLVKACGTVSEGQLETIPVPAVVNGDPQLVAERFDELLESVLSKRVPFQLVFNYHLGKTLAPASLLGHKYNLISLLTQWDNPEYFRRLDWDVGHFTNFAGRLERPETTRRYLLIRDSYKTFGWNGYHLQPEEYIRRGILRENDYREGGVLLVGPASAVDEVTDLLSTIGLETGLWDNGSPFLPGEDTN